MKQTETLSDWATVNLDALSQRFSSSALSTEEARTVMRMIQILEEYLQAPRSGKMSSINITLSITGLPNGTKD